MIGLDTNVLVRYFTRDDEQHLIGAVSRQVGCTETVSFDGKLNGERGFQCLE
jgi:predicted nucleic-acid-binding protein